MIDAGYQLHCRSSRVVVASLVATSRRLINSLLRSQHIHRMSRARIERRLVSISLLFAADSLDGHVANVLIEESSHTSVEKIESKRTLTKMSDNHQVRLGGIQLGLCRRRCGTDCNKGARVVALAMFMFDLRKRNIRVDRAGMCGVNESWKLETE